MKTAGRPFEEFETTGCKLVSIMEDGMTAAL
jgi:hypothetical protein